MAAEGAGIGRRSKAEKRPKITALSGLFDNAGAAIETKPTAGSYSRQTPWVVPTIGLLVQHRDATTAAMGALLIVLALAVAIALVFQRLGVSSLVAYLLTGCLAGPSLLHLIDHDQLEPIAEIGASLLLFSIGLELDVGELRRRLRAVLIASLCQVGLTILAVAGLGRLLGLAWSSAVAIGACVALSSTVMVLKALEERKLKHRDEGKLSLAMVLAQDIAIGPLLVLLSLIVPVANRPAPWLLAGGVVGLVVVVIALRRFLASQLLARVRRAQLPELEVAFTVIFALGAASLAGYAGLGAAAGAFAAGLAFGGEHRATVAASLHQLLGLTAMLFFAAIGALFDLSFAYANWPQVLGGVVLATLIKAPIAGFAARLAGLPLRSSLGVGLLLAPLGEFALVLAAAAFGAADQYLHQLVIAITCISFTSTPLVALLASRLLPTTRLDGLAHHGDTVVVAGLGPVGNAVVETLRNLGYPLLLVDRNPKLLAPWAGASGVRCHQGRIEDMEDWLPVLGHRPLAVVLTFPVPDASAMVAKRLRSLAPDLLVVARSPYQAQVGMLISAGVQHVICDELETAKALVPLLDQAIGHRSVRPTLAMPMDFRSDRQPD